MTSGSIENKCSKVKVCSLMKSLEVANIAAGATFYDKEHGSDHYRESNLLVAFFMNDNDGAWRKDFLRFVRVSGRRYSDLAEVVVAAGLDEETFARRFKAWAMAAAEGFRVPEGARIQLLYFENVSFVVQVGLSSR